MGAELTGNWNSFLERFSPSQQDIYYREEYLKLYQSLDEQAVCFVYTDGNFVFYFLIYFALFILTVSVIMILKQPMGMGAHFQY